MKIYIVYQCDVEDSNASEQLDVAVPALDKLRADLKKTKNPCGYGIDLDILVPGYDDKYDTLKELYP